MFSVIQCYVYSILLRLAHVNFYQFRYSWHAFLHCPCQVYPFSVFSCHIYSLLMPYSLLAHATLSRCSCGVLSHATFTRCLLHVITLMLLSISYSFSANGIPFLSPKD